MRAITPIELRWTKLRVAVEVGGAAAFLLLERVTGSTSSGLTVNIEQRQGAGQAGVHAKSQHAFASPRSCRRAGLGGAREPSRCRGVSGRVAVARPLKRASPRGAAAGGVTSSLQRLKTRLIENTLELTGGSCLAISAAARHCALASHLPPSRYTRMAGVGRRYEPATMNEPDTGEERTAQRTQVTYLKSVAQQLVHELTPVVNMKEMTRNSELLGAYAEAAVRNLVYRIVSPMRVSTGAVIDYPEPDRLRQIDIIIWMPRPAPAIFEVERFGMVPLSSAFGVLEVKRSNYSGIEDRFDGFMKDARDYKIVSRPIHRLTEDFNRTPALNVVTVLEKGASQRLRNMIDHKNTVAIVDSTEDRPTIRPKDIYVLVNFLYYIVWRHAASLAQPSFLQIPLEMFDEPEVAPGSDIDI